jgi:hypothetical protein
MGKKKIRIAFVRSKKETQREDSLISAGQNTRSQVSLQRQAVPKNSLIHQSITANSSSKGESDENEVDEALQDFIDNIAAGDNSSDGEGVRWLSRFSGVNLLTYICCIHLVSHGQ